MCGTAHDRHRSRYPARCTGFAVGLVLVIAIVPAAPCADGVDPQGIPEIEAARPLLNPVLSESTLRPALAFQVRLDDSRQAFASTGSLRSQWFSNVEGYLMNVRHGDLAVFPGRPFHEEYYYDSVNRAAFKGLRRATGRTIEEYLLAETGLDRIIDNIGTSVSSTPLASKLSSPKALAVDFSISSYLPEVQLKPNLGDDSMRIRLRANGTVIMAYRTEIQGHRCWLGTRFDPVRQKYTVGYTFGF
jgi:hypothetical protein